MALAFYPRAWPIRQITINVDGYLFPAKTHQGRVEDVLREWGLRPGREDFLVPQARQVVPSGGSIHLQWAVPVRLMADGKDVSYATTAGTVLQALAEAGVKVGGGDLVFKEGRVISQDEPLGEPPTSSPLVAVRPAGNGEELGPSLRAVPSRPDASVVLSVKRAVPIYVYENGWPIKIMTARETVAESLAEANIRLLPGDFIWPSPETMVMPDSRVFITRAKEVTITVGNDSRVLRTLKENVAELLAGQGVTLGPLDRLNPSPGSPIVNGLRIQIVRVGEAFVTDAETVGYKTVYRPDPALELDTKRVVQEGSGGERRWTTRIVYENGVEVGRGIVREWMEKEPREKIISYGTNVVVRQVDTPEGPMEYWRKMRVLASWYDARQGGRSRDDPNYGLTRMGLQAGRGIIAIDPTVIPFWTKMYVPGYGVGVAADTGGAVKGNIIDLAFDEGEEHTWLIRYMDIYLLGPPPPSTQILWMLPD
ncbi:MAG: DUF348 domain-containing protein [Chloroflexi bacterium]|nr:DUF348 domain-containing protein [Chloroflexota bacterium]